MGNGGKEKGLTLLPNPVRMILNLVSTLCEIPIRAKTREKDTYFEAEHTAKP